MKPFLTLLMCLSLTALIAQSKPQSACPPCAEDNFLLPVEQTESRVLPNEQIVRPALDRSASTSFVLDFEGLDNLEAIQN